MLNYVRKARGIDWAIVPGVTLPLQLFLCFFVYDSIYVPVHGLAHRPGIYALVHKHHHRQNSPFRGMWDGSNVNPIEFIVGTYLHIATLAIVEFCMLRCGLMMHCSVP